MIVGFTGTRNGMTDQQRNHLEAVLAGAIFGDSSSALHHGDCTGADVQAAGLAHDLGFRVICHPPINGSDRAFFAHNDFERQPLTYLARNRAIVQACELVVACPPTKEHQPRGGTWYTIDYARKVGKRVIVIAPDGTVEDSRAETAVDRQIREAEERYPDEMAKARAWVERQQRKAAGRP